MVESFQETITAVKEDDWINKVNENVSIVVKQKTIATGRKSAVEQVGAAIMAEGAQWTNFSVVTASHLDANTSGASESAYPCGKVKKKADDQKYAKKLEVNNSTASLFCGGLMLGFIVKENIHSFHCSLTETLHQSSASREMGTIVNLTGPKDYGNSSTDHLNSNASKCSSGAKVSTEIPLIITSILPQLTKTI